MSLKNGNNELRIQLIDADENFVAAQFSYFFKNYDDFLKAEATIAKALLELGERELKSGK